MWQITLETGIIQERAIHLEVYIWLWLRLGAGKLATLSIDMILNGLADFFWGAAVLCLDLK